ncbi:hypothetical protein [Kitasatospora kifunensis]|uniref:DUF4386 domain-containing protein n=1 Tax=Kitasatospora kifunensis TaxID=58351 RepID=A0A7W7VVG4_KITKI|nr:hypothetical protein [Kitasatospora kifunensis]MBB4924361.1 hypothetical protein [Kitasatospora kifunensis]
MSVTVPTTATAARPWPGALAGLAHVLFFLASLVLPDVLGQNRGAALVTPYSSDAEVTRYLAETSRSIIPIAAFCQAMSALALLVFVPYAADYVRRIAPERVSAGLVRATGTVAAAFLLLSASAQWILNRPGIGDNLQVYRAVMDLVFITGAAAQVVTTGLLVGTIATAARKARALPGWLNWLGLAVAALSALSMLSLMFQGATAFVPLGRFSGMAWFVGLTVVLLLRRHSLVATSAPHSAASPVRGRA